VRQVLDAGCVSASGSRRSNVGLDPTRRRHRHDRV
jgi:hypothetical protein